MHYRPSNATHCINNIQEIVRIYGSGNWPMTRPVITYEKKGPSYCMLPILSTAVSISNEGFRASRKLRAGSTIVTAGKDLKWRPTNILLSEVSNEISQLPYAVLIVFTDNKAIVVEGHHVFRLHSGQLMTADRLMVTDTLTSPGGDPVPIKSVHAGAYFAKFQIMITESLPVDDNLTNHFIVTNGVVSGDYTLPLSFHDNTLAPHLARGFNSRPIVGSDEYVEVHGPDCRDYPEGKIGYVKIKHHMPDNEADVFVPAKYRLMEIRGSVHCFFDTNDPIITEKHDSYPISDTIARHQAEEVKALYEMHYPDITFLLEWHKEEKNACAWKHNRKRYVSINGGVARLRVMGQEGFALFLSHEVGHHIGKDPAFPDGLSCEGESDYEGVNTVLRTIWGSQYPARIEKAIEQMAMFYRVPNSANPPNGSAFCSHPTKECRIATYHAGKGPNGKPDCAK